jgi:hypothetical protein
MKCSNPECRRRKSAGLFAGASSPDEGGVVREGLWYCSERCFRQTVLSDFLKRKHSGSELRTSTYPMTSRDFGAALLRSGKVSWSQIEDALEARSRNGNLPLAHYLMQKGLIDRHDILEALGRHHRVPLARVGVNVLDPAVTGLVPAAIAHLAGAIPIALDRNGGKLSLLMRDPSDLTTMLSVKRLTGYEIKAFQGDPAEIQALLARHYPGEPEPESEVELEDERLAQVR